MKYVNHERSVKIERGFLGDPLDFTTDSPNNFSTQILGHLRFSLIPLFSPCYFQMTRFLENFSDIGKNSARQKNRRIKIVKYLIDQLFQRACFTTNHHLGPLIEDMTFSTRWRIDPQGRRDITMKLFSDGQAWISNHNLCAPSAIFLRGENASLILAADQGRTMILCPQSLAISKLLQDHPRQLAVVSLRVFCDGRYFEVQKKDSCTCIFQTIAAAFQGLEVHRKISGNWWSEFPIFRWHLVGCYLTRKWRAFGASGNSGRAMQ